MSLPQQPIPLALAEGLAWGQLAMGLLGKREGQSANLKLPSGELEVDILEIQPVELAT